MLDNFKSQRALALAGMAYIAMVLFHIPNQLFRYIFDKNAPAQLFLLLLLALVYAVFIALKSHRFRFPQLIQYGAIALVGSLVASLLLSGNLAGSLYGDTGRFVGVASTVALLVVSIFHSQFNVNSFFKLLGAFVVAIELVAFIGIAQHFKLITLPGDQGVTATLGNADFFAAFVGTSLPLLALFALGKSRKFQALIATLATVNIYSLYLAGPLQGFLDIAFVLLGLAILLIGKKIPRRDLSLNKRTYLATFGVIIWAEFIFLMPFLGSFVPILGNDLQVKIRSNFWLDGMRQFFAHPFLGVGPDQYGNYYEQYRTLEDADKYANILSNDAHSASIQTLATTGIIGTLAFLFLISVVLRALFVIWDLRTFDRKVTFLLGLYIFVYLTNSFVSPITLTNKYLFWAICGFIVGNAFRLPSWKSVSATSLKLSLSSAAIFFAAVAFIFASAQIDFINRVEHYMTQQVKSPNATKSSVLPCFMYFDAELNMAGQVSNQKALEVATSELESHPRCVSALIAITRAGVNGGQTTTLGELVYRLNEIAPARAETISFGMYYASRVGDQRLALTLQKRMKALGLVYIPGKLG